MTFVRVRILLSTSYWICVPMYWIDPKSSSKARCNKFGYSNIVVIMTMFVPQANEWHVACSYSIKTSEFDNVWPLFAAIFDAKMFIFFQQIQEFGKNLHTSKFISHNSLSRFTPEIQVFKPFSWMHNLLLLCCDTSNMKFAKRLRAWNTDLCLIRPKSK